MARYLQRNASAMNDVRYVLTKYTIKLRDCTLFEQQAQCILCRKKARRNLAVLISNGRGGSSEPNHSQIHHYHATVVLCTIYINNLEARLPFNGSITCMFHHLVKTD